MEGGEECATDFGHILWVLVLIHSFSENVPNFQEIEKREKPTSL